MNTLETELKAKMGYTDEAPPRCDKCIHSEEKTDQAGGWYRLCNLNPAVTLSVRDSGRCNHHADVEKQTPQLPEPEGGLRQCNNWLRSQGKAYPRTCALCGLGKCHYPETK